MPRCVWCQYRQADAWYCDSCGWASGYTSSQDLRGSSPSRVSHSQQRLEMQYTEYDHFTALAGFASESSREARAKNWDVRFTRRERERIRANNPNSNRTKFGCVRYRYKKRTIKEKPCEQ